MKILVVDDDKVSLTKMKAILSKYGQIDLVETGVDAIKKVKEAYEIGDPYDLCTMDIEMPGMDGTQAVEGIRALEKELKILNESLKIIMVTVKGNDKNILSSFYNGCEWYIKKPITPKEIEEALKIIKLV